MRWIGSNVGIYLDVPLKVGMNGQEMGCKLLLNGVYRGYNPLTIFPNFLKHPTKGWTPVIFCFSFHHEIHLEILAR